MNFFSGFGGGVLTRFEEVYPRLDYDLVGATIAALLITDTLPSFELNDLAYSTAVLMNICRGSVEPSLQSSLNLSMSHLPALDLTLESISLTSL